MKGWTLDIHSLHLMLRESCRAAPLANSSPLQSYPEMLLQCISDLHKSFEADKFLVTTKSFQPLDELVDHMMILVSSFNVTPRHPRGKPIRLIGCTRLKGACPSKSRSMSERGSIICRYPGRHAEIHVQTFAY